MSERARAAVPQTIVASTKNLVFVADVTPSSIISSPANDFTCENVECAV